MLSEVLFSPSDIKIIYQKKDVNRKLNFSLFFFSSPRIDDYDDSVTAKNEMKMNWD